LEHLKDDYVSRAFFNAAIAHIVTRQTQGLLPDKDPRDILLGCVGEILDQYLPMPIKVEFENEESERLGLPTFAKNDDAGMDLRVCLPPEDRKDGIVIYPNERHKLPTGMKMQFPPGIWGRISHRSSTEHKRRLRIIEGTIDCGYRGWLFSQCTNHNTYPVPVKHGQRLAQMILARTVQRPMVEGKVSVDSDRSTSGFGSTGD